MRRMSILAGAKYLFVGGVVAAAFAAASPVVHADGMAPKAAAMQPTANWSGFYVGTNTGYAFSSIDSSSLVFGNTSVDYDTEYWGLVLGVQHQFGGVVAGVEGNLLSFFVDKPGTAACPLVAGFTCAARAEDILSLGGRLGVPMGHWMPYVSGGYASTSIAYRTRLTAAPFTAFEDSRSRTDGWYVGVGFDMVVAPGWTTGLEYRHYDFGSVNAPAFTPAGVNPIDFVTQSPTIDTLSIRLTYKWDIPGRYAAPPLK